MAGIHCNYYTFEVLLMADDIIELEVSKRTDNDHTHVVKAIFSCY